MKVIVSQDPPHESVEWKGKIYLPGQRMDLPKDEAERLIQKGKAVPDRPGAISKVGDGAKEGTEKET